MDVKKAVETRRSIRKYSEKKVPKDLLEEVLEAGRLSHSAINRQPWFFMVIDEEELLQEIVEKSFVYDQNKNCPALIITFGNKDSSKMSCGLERNVVDTSIATSYMQLRAHELGLGTCWIGAFQEGVIEEILDAPEEWQAMHVTTIGYAEESPNARPRKDFKQVASFNGFD